MKCEIKFCRNKRAEEGYFVDSTGTVYNYCLPHGNGMFFITKQELARRMGNG